MSMSNSGGSSSPVRRLSSDSAGLQPDGGVKEEFISVASALDVLERLPPSQLPVVVDATGEGPGLVQEAPCLSASPVSELDEKEVEVNIATSLHADVINSTVEAYLDGSADGVRGRKGSCGESDQCKRRVAEVPIIAPVPTRPTLETWDGAKPLVERPKRPPTPFGLEQIRHVALRPFTPPISIGFRPTRPLPPLPTESPSPIPGSPAIAGEQESISANGTGTGVDLSSGSHPRTCMKKGASRRSSKHVTFSDQEEEIP